MEMNGKAKVSPPWVTYWREMNALFEEDPEVVVLLDEDAKEIKVLVENQDKAEALAALLPTEKVFGNVILNIAVVPANGKLEIPRSKIARAFRDNPALVSVDTYDTAIGSVMFAIFQKKVVQFYNDNMADPNGLKSTLYEDIARDVFGDSARMFFCTENGEEDEDK